MFEVGCTPHGDAIYIYIYPSLGLLEEVITALVDHEGGQCWCYTRRAGDPIGTKVVQLVRGQDFLVPPRWPFITYGSSGQEYGVTPSAPGEKNTRIPRCCRQAGSEWDSPAHLFIFSIPFLKTCLLRHPHLEMTFSEVEVLLAYEMFNLHRQIERGRRHSCLWKLIGERRFGDKLKPIVKF